jgi:GT2 family glycosyltransferase
LTASVVVVTCERPDCVARCLEHQANQRRVPDELIVVDASRDARTEQLVKSRFPEVRYQWNPLGYGHIATLRAIGFGVARSDIVVFATDDAFVELAWPERLTTPYADSRVGGVGGRTLNGQPGEALEGRDAFGRLRPDGTLSGDFAADLGCVIKVDHLVGANMSFRRAALHAVGGIRDNYPGTGRREETDNCLRVRAAARLLSFAPGAVAHERAARHARGARSDLRYVYYSQRKHTVLLLRDFGLAAPLMGRFAGDLVRELARTPPAAGRAVRTGKPLRSAVRPVVRAGVGVGGLVEGVVAGVGLVLADHRSARGSSRPDPGAGARPPELSSSRS